MRTIINILILLFSVNAFSSVAINNPVERMSGPEEERILNQNEELRLLASGMNHFFKNNKFDEDAGDFLCSVEVGFDENTHEITMGLKVSDFQGVYKAIGLPTFNYASVVKRTNDSSKFIFRYQNKTKLFNTIVYISEDGTMIDRITVKESSFEQKNIGTIELPMYKSVVKEKQSLSCTRRGANTNSDNNGE